MGDGCEERGVCAGAGGPQGIPVACSSLCGEVGGTSSALVPQEVQMRSLMAAGSEDRSSVGSYWCGAWSWGRRMGFPFALEDIKGTEVGEVPHSGADNGAVVLRGDRQRQLSRDGDLIGILVGKAGELCGSAGGSDPPAGLCSSQRVGSPALLTSPAGPLWAGQPTLKFVMDTSKFWFKPTMSRDRGEDGCLGQPRAWAGGPCCTGLSPSVPHSHPAAAGPGAGRVPGAGQHVVPRLLRAGHEGSRRSRWGPGGVRGCHRTLRPRGADGLSVSPKGDESSDLVRHFLIESSAKGVHLRGASEELYFGKDSRHRRDTTPGPPLRAPSSCAPRGTDGG